MHLILVVPVLQPLKMVFVRTYNDITVDILLLFVVLKDIAHGKASFFPNSLENIYVQYNEYIPRMQFRYQKQFLIVYLEIIQAYKQSKDRKKIEDSAFSSHIIARNCL